MNAIAWMGFKPQPHRVKI